MEKARLRLLLKTLYILQKFLTRKHFPFKINLSIIKGIMKKFWIQVIVLVAIIFISMYVSFDNNTDLLNSLLPASSQPTQKSQLKIDDTTLTVEVADTPQTRNQGLSGRDSLSPNSGMLFVFPDTKKDQFWMKDMKFPLDFIFIRSGKIVDLIQNVPVPAPNQPDSSLPIYEPVEPIDMMLEVNAGFVRDHNIKVGDTIYLVK